MNAVVTHENHAEVLTFLREAVRDRRTVGAVAPSGRALAEVLTAPVRDRPAQPLTVLEVGAGTGSVTRALLGHMPTGSNLDIIEANPRFAARLRRLVDTRDPLTSAAATAEIHEMLLSRFATERRYDVIVSGLPMTNFEPGEVNDIMARLVELLHPEGTLTYFAYVGTRAARRLVSAPAQARRHDAVEAVLQAWRAAHTARRRTVWANLPPAHVWHLRSALRGLADRPAA
ncbi:class I SAM-dependent methyltransferase [Actinoplanes sp. DH11]|uniref:class I SAM-dependent methyltransferase n=1 Tax=Actinoplanes sp. DH11 TaxID=2857011 RepID=UPI001E5E566F|nr:methyltransferase domain-containing protein [Actinoplanes sp. DH11]